MSLCSRAMYLVNKYVFQMKYNPTSLNNNLTSNCFSKNVPEHSANLSKPSFRLHTLCIQRIMFFFVFFAALSRRKRTIEINKQTTSLIFNQ